MGEATPISPLEVEPSRKSGVWKMPRARGDGGGRYAVLYLLTCRYPQQRSDGCVQAHEWGGEQKGEQENAPRPRVITAIDLAHTHGQRFQ